MICPNCECDEDIWLEVFADDIDRGEHKCLQEKIDLLNKDAKSEKKTKTSETKHT